jgi:hypothetical protein
MPLIKYVSLDAIPITLLVATFAMQNKNTSSKLLDQMRDCIRVKHYSIRTETQYVQWIKRFIQRHPQEMGIAKVEVF